jgi:hypothetical protein
MALAATRCPACGANYQRALRAARGEPATDAAPEVALEKAGFSEDERVRLLADPQIVLEHE